MQSTPTGVILRSHAQHGVSKDSCLHSRLSSFEARKLAPQDDDLA
jgi:hypothetical protein